MLKLPDSKKPERITIHRDTKIELRKEPGKTYDNKVKGLIDFKKTIKNI